MTFSSDFLEQLRDLCTIESVASDYVPLKPRGRNYLCNCPFHSEKTPSCTIYPETQSFYCFGCGAGGDVITWVKQIENVDFSEAVKMLASRCGLPLETDQEAEKRSALRTQILAINRETANFYYRNLVSGSDKRGLQYFISRGIRPEIIRKYGLGYAPDSWTILSEHLLQKGFSVDELIAADVCHRSEKGRVYDAFRERVMFPIVDTRGMVIGFGARVIDKGSPKYINTAKTLVFDKGHNLFSLNFAKDSSSTQMILAEGYMDVIAIHQAGFMNVIATLGTAITADQARKIAQYAKSVIIAYDGDSAGQTATQKALNHFSEVGLPTRILQIPGGLDPDEYIRAQGPERFRQLLDSAEDAVNFRIDQCQNGLNMTSEAGKVQFLRRVIPVLSEIQDPLEREVYLSRVANQWEISVDVLQSQVKRNLNQKNNIAKTKVWKDIVNKTVRPEKVILGEKPVAARAHKAEECVILAILTHPEDYRWIMAELEAEDFETPLYRKVYAQYQACDPPFSLSLLDDILSDEELGRIARLQSGAVDVIPTQQEVRDCIARMHQPKEKVVETNEDLEALVRKKQHSGEK